MAFNVFVAVVNVATGKFLRETCDYCHKGSFRESVVDRAIRRQSGCPTLHYECADYLCHFELMEKWRKENGFNSSKHCEFADSAKGPRE
jgi:hypothetical protein